MLTNKTYLRHFLSLELYWWFTHWQRLFQRRYYPCLKKNLSLIRGTLHRLQWRQLASVISNWGKPWKGCTNNISNINILTKNTISGPGRAAWMLWVYVSVILQMFAFVLLFKHATLTEKERANLLGEDQRKLLDSADGQARYGAGMLYRNGVSHT